MNGVPTIALLSLLADRPVSLLEWAAGQAVAWFSASLPLVVFALLLVAGEVAIFAFRRRRRLRRRRLA